jgi:hypothetical protein
VCVCVCVSVCISPLTTFECLNQSLWNLVCISYHLRPSQRRTKWIPFILSTKATVSEIDVSHTQFLVIEKQVIISSQKFLLLHKTLRGQGWRFSQAVNCLPNTDRILDESSHISSQQIMAPGPYYWESPPVYCATMYKCAVTSKLKTNNFCV